MRRKIANPLRSSWPVRFEDVVSALYAQPYGLALALEHCAGSLGPADLAENGWPLDCINKCVPLPPEHVGLH